jgi:hypothetical protein
VYCQRRVIEKNIEPGRAFWVYLAQHSHRCAVAFSKERDSGARAYRWSKDTPVHLRPQAE